MARWGAQRAGAAGRLALAALAVQLCAAAGQEEASARSATAAPPLRGPLPGKIGVVGVGTIGSALVQGILRAPPSRLADPPPFVLSPRNAAKAAALRAEFPSKVTVASSDQQVLDEAALVVLALPGSTAEGVLQALRFRQGLQVVSLIAAVKFPRLEALLGPGVNCTVALPMPAIAKQRGVTLGFPWRPYAEAMFSVTGSYTAADSLEDFTRLAAVGAFMGDFYKRQLTIQQWLVQGGVQASKAAAHVGAIFATFAADSEHADPNTFALLVSEQTPGGLNEMVWKQQEADGVYGAVNASLDAVYRRTDGSGTLVADATGNLHVV